MIKKATLTAAVLCLAVPAFADGTQGSIGRTYFDCGGSYKLWKILWFGVTGFDPLSGPSKDLQKAPTNHGPWSTAVADIDVQGYLAPAENLRWYRAQHMYNFVQVNDHNQSGYHHPYGVVHYTSLCWVPQQQCSGQQPP